MQRAHAGEGKGVGSALPWAAGPAGPLAPPPAAAAAPSGAPVAMVRPSGLDNLLCYGHYVVHQVRHGRVCQTCGVFVLAPDASHHCGPAPHGLVDDVEVCACTRARVVCVCVCVCLCMRP
jgi:hypothetical protein